MKFNINKLLKLKIQGKLAFAFAGLSILPVLIVGYLGITTNVHSLRQMAVENLNHDLFTTKERVAAFFQIAEDNVHALASSSSFQRYVKAVLAPDTALAKLAAKDLYPEITRLAQRKGFVHQVKFINRHGDEIFTFDKSNGTSRFLTPDELNRYGTRFYLHFAEISPANRAIFIPVELYRREEQELLPAISCIYPIYLPDFSGLLIFHIAARNFFEILERQNPLVPGGKVMLVNSDGYYLYHSEKKKKWDQLLATRETDNLKVEYGEETATQLLTRDSKSILEINGEIIAHAPIFINDSEFENEYSILKSVSKAQIYAPIDLSKKFLWGILIFFLFNSLFLAYLATQQFTRPIQKLHQEAKKIAGGDYHSRVNVQTYDEIETLAQQFNLMAETLEQREREIARHQERLEQAVQARTKELKSEKNKLQAILDNVPSGFMLLDKNYRIVSASAAVTEMSKKPNGALIGKTCFEVLGDGEMCTSCPTKEAMKSGATQSRLLRRLNTDGDDCFFEHTAVPLKKGREVEFVLEIITDITERKRLQDQLIRSERLATTGEIAAFIAHEMRNSLTSIRMLLQLLTETDYLKSTDRESLDVALSSLGRIEHVVNDMLQLARPAPLNKKPEHIDQIIEESVDFARHQITSKGIRLDINLAPDLPRIMLDRDQIKEAIVNLLMNAAQATDATGEISVSCKQKSLRRQLRELGEVGIVTSDKQTVAVREIALKKDTRVLEVEITDTGVGIAEEHLSRIFDPFFTTKTSGTGLGLSFVKRVVNEHGGIVTVKSKPGKGSTFYLILPILDEKLA